MSIKAVFFDLFETLVTEFSEENRISKRNYDYMETLGLSNEEFKIEWRSRHKERMTGFFPNYPSVIKDILAKRELHYNEKSVEYLYQERIREKVIPFRDIRPVIIDLLSFLRNKKIKLGLVSNCTEEEVRHWHHSELVRYFDDVIFSYEVGFAKPDIRIYQLACKRLKVEPAESVFIGDGGSKELEGAFSAGLTPYHAIWFNTYIESNYKKLIDPAGIKELIK